MADAFHCMDSAARSIWFQQRGALERRTVANGAAYQIEFKNAPPDGDSDSDTASSSSSSSSHDGDARHIFAPLVSGSQISLN